MRLRRKFEVDRSEAKLMGVCAGIANHLGVDVTFVRVGVVVGTLIGGWPWTVIAYVALGFIGNARRVRGERGAHAAVGYDHEGGGERLRDFDRRLAEIDTYVASSNSQLAREIEDLR